MNLQTWSYGAAASPTYNPLAPLNQVLGQTLIGAMKSPADAYLYEERPSVGLIDFSQMLWSGFQAARHHVTIAEALEDVSDGTCKRLIIVMPPRHGKSTLASEMFPAWFLGKNPNKRVIACSHTATLANTFSRRARAKIRDHRYPWKDLRIDRESASVQNWNLEGYRGGYLSAGVGGSITGHGADVLIVDDAVKDSQEARSPTVRETTYDWYISTAVPRVEPGGAIVLIGTRWHTDDIIGRVLEAEGDEADGGQWRVIHLPAINDEGEGLWPERFTMKDYLDKKAQVGLYNWAAQYQGNPVPEGGAIIHAEWLRWYELPQMKYERIIQSWDTGYKTEEGNDYSVCATIGLSFEGYDVLDLWREKVEFPELERQLVNQARKWHPDEIVIEDKASGQSLIQAARRKKRLVVHANKAPNKDGKEKRLHDASPIFESGLVGLPSWSSWGKEASHELSSAPFGKHDDIADAIVQGVMRLAGWDKNHGNLEVVSYVDGGEAGDDDSEVDYRVRRMSRLRRVAGRR